MPYTIQCHTVFRKDIINITIFQSLSYPIKSHAAAATGSLNNNILSKQLSGANH
jgi:hypothetical protein